jgi:dihydroorotase
LVALFPGPADQPATPKYELLLRGGHVIDPRNGINAPRDVAIAAGRVAAAAPAISPSDALKTIGAG